MRWSVLVLACLACSGGDPDGHTGTTETGTTVTDTDGTTVTDTDGPDPGAVLVSYVRDGGLFLHDVDSGDVVNVSNHLDGLTENRADTVLNLAPDGASFAVITERFDPNCDGWACVAVVASDFSSAELVAPPSGAIHPEEVAVASGGELVVYNDSSRILFVTRLDNGAWSEPVAISTSSPYAYAWRPAISADGTTVLFDCGDELFPATAICEVGVDGTGFQVVATADGGAAGSGPGVHHADYAPDGSVVFEAEYQGSEQVWGVPAAGGAAEVIASQYTNDNSPCVLHDGRIASLWLNRPESEGYHELKVMDADGSNEVMLVVDVDIYDYGLGCG